MLSFSGAIESSPQTPSSCDALLRATRAITRRADDVADAFRRMVFNALARNREDHTRQHAFLMDESGHWRLASAYGGEHYLDIEGEGRRPTRARVEALAKRHGLSHKQTLAAIDDVRSAIAGWDREGIGRGRGVQNASCASACARAGDIQTRFPIARDLFNRRRGPAPDIRPAATGSRASRTHGHPHGKPFGGERWFLCAGDFYLRMDARQITVLGVGLSLQQAETSSDFAVHRHRRHEPHLVKAVIEIMASVAV